MGSYFSLIFALIPIGILSGCSYSKSTHELRMVVDQPPTNLDPTLATDAISQRLVAVLFRGLLRLDAKLQVKPDLALSLGQSGRIHWIELPESLNDADGKKITPQDWKDCYESYLSQSAYKAVFITDPPEISLAPSHKGRTRLVLKTKFPNPEIFNNLNLFRFFRDRSHPEVKACLSSGSPPDWVGVSHYFWENPSRSPELELALKSKREGYPDLRFLFVREATTRAFLMLSGRAELAQNAFHPTLTHFLAKRFPLYHADGVNVSYVALNMKRPEWNDKRLRKAISMLIPRAELSQFRYRNSTSPASSFISPSLKDARQETLENPEEGRKTLTELGIGPKKSGLKPLHLEYLCTTSREGIELATFFKGYFSPLGIELNIKVVEPAVFWSKLKKGEFSLFSSRWIGVSDWTILDRTLRSDSKDNRVSYKNTEVDQWIEEAKKQEEGPRRSEWIQKIQAKMNEDLPYIPLWFWNNEILLHKDWKFDAENLSMSGSYEPLTEIRKNSL